MLTAEHVYRMLGNAVLWRAAQQCHKVLSGAHVPHALVGGVAVCLHGYQRNTTDLDVLIRKEDAQDVRLSFERDGYKWHAKDAQFLSPAGIAIQLLLSGDKAGRDSEVLLPDPADARTTTEVEGLPVLTLARLIETKIACGEGSVRRMHKDFADVVELIIANRLNSSFARYLHKSVRPTYRRLARASRGEK
jgi:hypothetical protein